ncbi:MAG TPA: type I DNA topoisomerase [Tepiditoga sp.]|nr:type I DNA topoisomerase [Tepiditoga sp.]
MEKNEDTKYLVIVESPAKAKTIERYLGKDYKVIASKGHVRDLPAKKFGVDIENNFEPQFEIMEGKDSVIKEIKKLSKNKKILLAADMDREGEAIAWHLSEILKLKKKEKNRIIFSEITKNSILESIKNPKEIDLKKVDTQIARRLLDRIVGYKVSPLLWKILKNYTMSAGRVQSAALKILVDRERKINKFKPKKYFKIFLLKDELKIPLIKIDGKKFKAETIDESKKDEIINDLKNTEYSVNDVTKRTVQHSRPMPFITSTLQQAAVNIYNWPSKKTMQVAQILYEGVDTTDGHLAFITYMRTDSTRISEFAQENAEKYIKSVYGEKYWSKYFYKEKKTKVQDAHEAIRPTNIDLNPEKASKLIKGDNLKLYTMIWNRFMASQSSNSSYEEIKYSINDNSGKYTFEINKMKKVFDGFEIFWKSGETEKDFNLNEKGKIKDCKLTNEEAETKPPARFTEASIVKELESKEIGRPSTYSTIISTLINRKYVKRIEKNTLRPTITGFVVTDFLEKSFPEVVDAKFTANMEESLDKIEEGDLTSKTLLNDFYSDFSKLLSENDKKIKEKEITLSYKSEIKCSECGGEMELKYGRFGMYLACDKCNKTLKVPLDTFGITTKDKIVFEEDLEKYASPESSETGEKCPECGSPLLLKKGRFGEFIACSNYPACKYTKSIPARGLCPKCGSEVGKLVSKKGKQYFKCTNKNCGEMFWKEPSNFKNPNNGNHLFYTIKNKNEKLYDETTKEYFNPEEFEKS